MTVDDRTPTPGLDRRDLLRLVGLIAALLAIVAVVLLASGGGGAERPSSGQVTGILTSVTPERLVLRPSDGGEAQTFAIRPQDRQNLDLIHLQQHAADALPSIVHYEREGDERFA
ncbi:MAG TPA: hypothetical protein VHF89_11455, partial [Solirubrobacteraceae bacterium]|nr:hypothetical protein [Solirubrobacteraceae bacterium]